jgi:DNA-binding LacI/PurR family transcriptional regulator
MASTSTHRSTGRPTLEDVAARAGVSRATVSRVVNRHSTVDPALAAAVNRAIDDLGYAPNRAARALMTNRTDAIALVAAEPGERVFGDPFFGGIVRGVSQELAGHGQQLILCMISDEAERDRVERYLLGRHTDGVLLISEHGRDGLPALLARENVPLVVGGRPLDTSAPVPYVDNDNVDGARQATEHLVGLGRQVVATVSGPADMSAPLDRLKGYREILGPRFRPELVQEGDFSTAGGYAATTALLDRVPELDALFVANDLMAIGALAALRDRGRRVPQDVAVIGFDDIDLAAISDPPLTTIRQETIEQGRAMVRMLLDLIGVGSAGSQPAEAGDRASLVLPVRLVRRDSA